MNNELNEQSLPCSSRESCSSSPSRAESPRWYALLTKPRHEKSVRDRLAGHGIGQLLPTVKRLSQWKDRRQEIEAPLFSCYCFARFQWRDRLTVLNLPGVLQIVGSGSRPEPIPDEEIDSLRTLMRSTLQYDAHPYLREGMAVEVIRGPLEGVRGILLRKTKPYRLVISVKLIQQAAAVEIDADNVMPIERSRDARHVQLAASALF